MTRLLVTYATLSGSTAEAARFIGDELAQAGFEVDVLPLGSVSDVAPYAGVVVGGPMILGWHRRALAFLKRHRRAWRRTPVAVFVLAMSLTQTGEESVWGVPVTVDARLPKPPARPGRLSLRERHTTLSNYLRPILTAVRPARPASLGVFAGRLEYGRLPWWAVIFAMLIVQAAAGDRRDWEALRAWARALPAAMGLAEAQAGREAQLA
jgi:menaquinone-dependent protoporphyrinogen oxidase